MKTGAIRIPLSLLAVLFCHYAVSQPSDHVDLPEGYRWFYNPNNGHYYGLSLGQTSWIEANESAMHIGGTLAVIESPDENEWIADTILGANEIINELWIGLVLRDGVWEWSDGSELDYDNWGPGEPSGGSGQPYGQIVPPGKSLPTGTWRDDGIVNRFQFLVEYAPFPELPGGYDWFYNPGNGQYYGVSHAATSWIEARDRAERIGGHLAVIESAEENDWILEEVVENVNPSNELWIGLVKILGKWVWFDGKEPSYTNWGPGEPSGGFEQIYGQFVPPGKPLPAGTWRDDSDVNSFQALVELGGEIPDPPRYHHELGFENGEQNHILIDTPRNHIPGDVEFGDLPLDYLDDTKGIAITLAPGEGVFAVHSIPIDAGIAASIRCRLRASNKEASIALVALDYPAGPEFAYINMTGSPVPVMEYGEFELVYKPSSSKMLVGIQAVNSEFSSITTNVWVDYFRVEPFNAGDSGAIELRPDGGFDHGLEGILTNINNDTGQIEPIFESIEDVALKLSIGPDDTAANTGLLTHGIGAGDFPLRLFGSVSVRNAPENGGGTFGFVMTNGFQNMGLFTPANRLSGQTNGGYAQVYLGGKFNSHNPDLPVLCVMQIGGPGEDASVIVDDLRVQEF